MHLEGRIEALTSKRLVGIAQKSPRKRRQDDRLFRESFLRLALRVRLERRTLHDTHDNGIRVIRVIRGFNSEYAVPFGSAAHAFQRAVAFTQNTAVAVDDVDSESAAILQSQSQGNIQPVGRIF